MNLDTPEQENVRYLFVQLSVVLNVTRTRESSLHQQRQIQLPPPRRNMNRQRLTRDQYEERRSSFYSDRVQYNFRCRSRCPRSCTAKFSNRPITIARTAVEIRFARSRGSCFPERSMKPAYFSRPTFHPTGASRPLRFSVL